MRKPSTKWFTATITAVTGWIVALIENDLVVDSTLAISAVGIVSSALLSYIAKNSVDDVTNQDTRGGDVVVARVAGDDA